jgi:hypothetical protein
MNNSTRSIRVCLANGIPSEKPTDAAVVAIIPIAFPGQASESRSCVIDASTQTDAITINIWPATQAGKREIATQTMATQTPPSTATSTHNTSMQDTMEIAVKDKEKDAALQRYNPAKDASVVGYIWDKVELLRTSELDISDPRS